MTKILFSKIRKLLTFLRFFLFVRLGGLFFILFFSLQEVRGQAQETVIVGQVFDKFTKSPLASVDVYFKNTSVAVQTNDDGYFLIRYTGNERTLVFSLIGYKKEQVKINPGQSVGLQMELEEQINYLNEILVLPGANPADDLMKKVREKRYENKVKNPMNSVEQSAVFLQKKDFQNHSLFRQFKDGNLSGTDSVLLAPLYIEQSEYKHADKQKIQLSQNTFNTPKQASLAVSQLLSGLDERINFYENSIPVLGKSIVSPLANIGNAYYTYYLKDSIQASTGKQYEVQFWSKNIKNLAFNGTIFIDSASLALVKIDVQLPPQANLNFIHHLNISQNFTPQNGRWIPASENAHWSLAYEVIADSLNKKPELFISRNTVFRNDVSTTFNDSTTFAGTGYSEKEMTERMEALNENSLFKFAKYVADAALTGYMKVWKFDVGNITSIARLTEQEGFRIGLPIRTNETLWKNFMLGGMLGYGFGDHAWKYAGDVQWKVIPQKNLIAGVHYQNDYHWVHYDKNDFLWRENPIGTCDENITSTLLSFKTGKNNSRRENYSFFVRHDWNGDIESNYIVGQETMFANNKLPLFKDQMEFSELKTQYLTVSSRFSFNERVLNEHFQRLYVNNDKPVIYGIAEAGKFILGNRSGYYAHLSAEIFQHGRFTLGEWKYFAETGKVFGSVPYPLLKFFNTKSNGGYNLYQFSLMNFFEFPMDTYASFHSEVITNGILFNQIPLIKHLNLREIASFKMGYGPASHSHEKWLDYPVKSDTMKYPYAEVSVGFTNLFKIISVQSVWRLSDLNKSSVIPWRVTFYTHLYL